MQDAPDAASQPMPTVSDPIRSNDYRRPPTGRAWRNAGAGTYKRGNEMKRIVIGALTVLVALSGATREAAGQSAAAKAAPSAAIPKVSMANVARYGAFYAGGQYVGEIGPMKEPTMGGAMYFEVMVPKQIKSPY